MTILRAGLSRAALFARLALGTVGAMLAVGALALVFRASTSVGCLLSAALLTVAVVWLIASTPGRVATALGAVGAVAVGALLLVAALTSLG